MFTLKNRSVCPRQHQYKEINGPKHKTLNIFCPESLCFLSKNITSNLLLCTSWRKTASRVDNKEAAGQQLRQKHQQQRHLQKLFENTNNSGTAWFLNPLLMRGTLRSSHVTPLVFSSTPSEATNHRGYKRSEISFIQALNLHYYSESYSAFHWLCNAVPVSTSQLMDLH